MDNLCECGCGKTTTVFRGTPRKFISGHNGRLQGRRDIIISADGYELKLAPEHHFANYYGRVRNHRLIYEKHFNLSLLPWTQIHHINGNKLDNRIENLQTMICADHSRIHHIVDMSDRRCSECGTDRTQWDKRGWLMWFDNKNGGWYCRRCYKRLKYNKKI